MAKNKIDKSELLPKHYIEVEEPFYGGPGDHNVRQLELICSQYKEFVHQLRVREESIKNKFKIEITNGKS